MAKCVGCGREKPAYQLSTAGYCGVCNARIGREKAGLDAVSHPSHYCFSGIETWDFLVAAGLHQDHFLASALQYIVRAGKKDPSKLVEDLQKAVAYLQKRIALAEAEAPKPKE